MKKASYEMLSLFFILPILSLNCIKTPSNPDNPDNVKISLFLPDGETTAYTGEPKKAGVILLYPEYVDHIKPTTTCNDFDTVVTILSEENADTSFIYPVFNEEGVCTLQVMATFKNEKLKEITNEIRLHVLPGQPSLSISFATAFLTTHSGKSDTLCFLLQSSNLEEDIAYSVECSPEIEDDELFIFTPVKDDSIPVYFNPSQADVYTVTLKAVSDTIEASASVTVAVLTSLTPAESDNPVNLTTGIVDTLIYTLTEDQIADGITLELLNPETLPEGTATIIPSGSDSIIIAVNPSEEGDLSFSIVTSKDGYADTSDYQFSFTDRTTLTAIVTTGPDDEAKDIILTPVFTWTGGDDISGDSVFFHVIYGTSEDELNYKTGVVTTKSLTLSKSDKLSEKTSYFWQVIGWSKVYADTIYSEIATFTTFNPAAEDTSGPTITQTAGPADGDRVTASTGMITVSITDPNGISTVTASLNESTAMELSADENESFSYNFTLEAFGENTITFTAIDGSPDSISSNKIILIDYNTKPSSINLIAPVDSAENVSSSPVLEWSGGNDADSDGVTFTVNYGVSENSLNGIATIDGNTATVSRALDYNTTYFWRVTGTSESEVYDDEVESEIFTFSTEGKKPTITTELSGVSIIEDSELHLSIEVDAVPLPTDYTWYQNNTLIETTTVPEYNKQHATIEDSGEYFVIVDNGIGTDTSTTAIITVSQKDIAPVIEREPSDISRASGESITFEVEINNDAYPEPEYIRWIKDNTDTLHSADSLTYTIPSISYDDAGLYKIIVRNREGSAISGNARLTVNDETPPVITLNGASDTVVLLGSSWNDPLGTVHDDHDQNILPTAISVTGSVNHSTVGRYRLLYNFSDVAGNEAETMERIVRIEGWVKVAEFEGKNLNPSVITDDNTLYIPFVNSSEQVIQISNDEVKNIEIPPSGCAHTISIALGNDNSLYSGFSCHGIIQRFYSNNWELITDATIASNYISINVNSENIPYIVASFMGPYPVRRFTNNDWEILGNETNPSISLENCVDGKNICITQAGTVYTIGEQDSIVVCTHFNGSEWEKVGTNGIICDDITDNYHPTQLQLVTDGTSVYAGFAQSGVAANSVWPTCYRLDGSSWTGLEPFSNSDLGEGGFDITISSESHLYVAHPQRDNVLIRKYDGSSWKNIPEINSSVAFITEGSCQNVTISAGVNICFVTYETTDNKIIVMRWKKE